MLHFIDIDIAKETLIVKTLKKYIKPLNYKTYQNYDL